MRRYVAGVGSLLVFAAILVGVPALLVVVAGNPLPSTGQLGSILTFTPDYGNVILVTKVLPTIGWIAWAFFTIPMLIEVVASITGHVTGKRFRAFRFQQHLALTLIAAVLLLFAGAGTLAGPAPSASAAALSTGAVGAPPLVRAGAASGQTHMETTATALTPDVFSSTAATITVTHTVMPGDTLWDLAVQFYGDGTRYVDIYRASTSAVQPDGSQLTDPNLIRPGWLLTVPGVAVPTTPTPGPAAQAGSLSGSTRVPTGGTPAAGGHEGATEPTPSAAVRLPAPGQTLVPPTTPYDHVGENSNDPSADQPAALMTGGGIAGLLAAGVLVVLRRRRLQQRRHRHAGERIAMPDPEPHDLEVHLRALEDPLQLEHVDNALRVLQTWVETSGGVLPDLFAVRLYEDGIALYFGGPTSLPSPFVLSHEDQTIWTIRSRDASAPIQEAISPYPALTTIGVDRNGGVLLLNLEHVGSVNVIGDEALSRGFLNAVAAELASSPWADQIQVTIVGMAVELGHSLNASRVHQSDDVAALLRNLQHDLDDRRYALAGFEMRSVLQARSVPAGTESWAPHVVLIAGPVGEDTGSALQNLVDSNPNLGLVVVTQEGAEGDRATVRMNPDGLAELLLPGGLAPDLPFTPQLLQARELGLLQQLVDTTTRVSRPADQIGSAASRYAAERVDSVPVDKRDRTQPADDRVGEGGEITRADEESLWPDWSAPYLRLLGPVDMLYLEDETAMPGRGIELIAYLNLNGAVEGRQLQRAFWPDAVEAGNNQRQLARKVRVALGHTPEGQPLLPENTQHHGYRLHRAIRSDWDDFRAHIGNDPTAAETEDLLAALKLVRGQPFANCNTRRWWQWVSFPEEDMLEAILDTADELAGRALAAGDQVTAHFAARVAQNVDPLNEAGWRIEMSIAIQSGDSEGFGRILEDLYARVGGHDPDYELDEDTQQLVDSFATEKAKTL
ncbi:LysM peptidoglycan-binding domain-containing protein [Rathayibacter soli]|uniref:LysM peptidoglycan-binding domain-containing protein n=1 Tax=Rathayibacter soli TaxID=3144168 RepID=UPI0027E44292|nr:LysM peptidoglycan-binding domain-containing protein [Glaciibacter superstes]